jgi:hypothetical protein
VAAGSSGTTPAAVCVDVSARCNLSQTTRELHAAAHLIEAAREGIINANESPDIRPASQPQNVLAFWGAFSPIITKGSCGQHRPSGSSRASKDAFNHNELYYGRGAAGCRCVLQLQQQLPFLCCHVPTNSIAAVPLTESMAASHACAIFSVHHHL